MNPLRLYPGELRWSGREKAYNGAFLSLTGNADLEKWTAAEYTEAVKDKVSKKKGFANYWLRNAGEKGFCSAVTYEGKITEGSSASSNYGIRPMMWVKIG